MTRPETTLLTEVLAALEDLAAQLGEGTPAHDPAGVRTGSVPDFRARFLAWCWVLRAACEGYGLTASPAEVLDQAARGAVNDEEMVQNLNRCRAVLAAQDRGDPDAVEAALAAFEGPVDQVPAMGLLLLGARQAVRDVAARLRIPAEAIVQTLREVAQAPDPARGRS